MDILAGPMDTAENDEIQYVGGHGDGCPEELDTLEDLMKNTDQQFLGG